MSQPPARRLVPRWSGQPDHHRGHHSIRHHIRSQRKWRGGGHTGIEIRGEEGEVCSTGEGCHPDIRNPGGPVSLCRLVAGCTTQVVCCQSGEDADVCEVEGGVLDTSSSRPGALRFVLYLSEPGLRGSGECSGPSREGSSTTSTHCSSRHSFFIAIRATVSLSSLISTHIL